MQKSVEAKSILSRLTNLSAASLGDLALSFVLFGICGSVLNAAFKMRPSPYEPLGPAFFPKAIAGIILILATLLVIKAILNRGVKIDSDDTGAPEFDQTPLLSLGVFVGTCVFVALIGTGWLNFGLLSFIFLASMALFLSTAVKVNRVIVVVVALAISSLSYVLFTQVFSVVFPS